MRWHASERCSNLTGHWIGELFGRGGRSQYQGYGYAASGLCGLAARLDMADRGNPSGRSFSNYFF